MRARFALLMFAAGLAACSSKTDKQLEAVKSARSVISEWALVEQQSARGRAQGTYVGQMRELAKDELKTDQKALAGQADAAQLLDGLAMGSPDATTLKQAGSALEPLEKRLEAS
jgi:hypothetical protein